MPTYAYTDLVVSVTGLLHNQLGQLAGTNVTTRTVINDGVRACLEIDFRSTKRKAGISPDLFNDIFHYGAPTDLKRKKIIDLQPQVFDNRDLNDHWILTTEEEFDRRKSVDSGLLSVSDNSFVRKVLASIVPSVEDYTLTISSLNGLTADGGTWALFGDGTNLAADTYNYIKGSGSVKYDLSAAGGTTAGMQNTAVSTFDLTRYSSAGSVFVWAYITSATNITNFKIRLGNDSSNYYEMTATTTNEGTAFAAGWNLLRFDFSGKTTTGTVSVTSCDYVVLYMTKTSGKVSETDYRFDHIIAKVGSIWNLIYYSKYMWQTSAGVWIENSTADTDKLNLDTDEYAIVVEKCVEYIARGIREYAEDYKIARDNYKILKAEYQQNYKSEALLETTTYYKF